MQMTVVRIALHEPGMNDPSTPSYAKARRNISSLRRQSALLVDGKWTKLERALEWHIKRSRCE
jgi:hypothetical protein